LLGCCIIIAVFGNSPETSALRSPDSQAVAGAIAFEDEAAELYVAKTKRPRAPSKEQSPKASADAPGLAGTADSAPLAEPPASAEARKDEAPSYAGEVSSAEDVAANQAIAASSKEEDVKQAPAVLSDALLERDDSRQVALAQGGNLTKKLIVHIHFHACSGKRICKWARDLDDDRARSGVRLDGMQRMTAACNQIDPDPPNVWLNAKMNACSDMWSLTKNHGGSNFMFIETPLDVRPPCPGMAFVTVIRQPWSRLESTQGKRGWTFPNASALIRCMKVGDDPLDDKFKWMFCDSYHAPTCQPFFKAGYFNNYYVRSLLGMKEGARIPWGQVTEEHFEKVKKILEDFDLVIPIEHLADALPGLQCAFGPNYDVGLNSAESGGRYHWTTTHKKIHLKSTSCDYGVPGTWHDRTRIELCELFLANNEWDIKLWEWAVHRWINWQAGRCRGDG